MMKYKIILLITLLLSSSLLSALHEDAGTSGFAFLKMKISARAAAMANAYTALSDDPQAVFYNPAGLVQINKPYISTTYMNYIEGLNCGSFTFTFKKNKKRNLAIFSQFLTSTMTRQLQNSSGDYIGEDGTFGVSDLIIGISDSRFINDVLNLGVNIKFIRESLDDKSASAIVFDVGLMHQPVNKMIKVGASLTNVGRQLTYHNSNKERFPVTVCVGFKYQPDKKLITTLDIRKPFKESVSAVIGIEYQVLKQLALRSGYKTNASQWRTGGDYELLSGMSFGLGIQLHRYLIDYALVSFGDLGLVNQISLSYKF